MITSTFTFTFTFTVQQLIYVKRNEWKKNLRKQKVDTNTK